ncbi:hypothetical protein M413DRAFT_287083 [Hebeloma cylindrosporum]|uniref:F-box domain-containing protein n=1 Tax=Hebeloma cylindrosporum TaxID=76867 RepID=A0A0C3BXC7_HEBCY|nr:hypothetical protein M413DRAFT_287083 [Hebeloma cylindrosporum h7]
MFPQELIDRFIDEVAETSDPRDNLDLKSCSLVARCFRSRSQSHLLEYVQLSIRRGQTASNKIRKLREMLETREALRKYIFCLDIKLNALALDIDDEDVEWKFQDENLPYVLGMLPQIHQLHFGRHPLHPIPEWDRLSEDIKTALCNMRFTSPQLSFLRLSGISISVYSLVDSCKSIKEVFLSSVKMNILVPGGTSIKNEYALEYRLEFLNIIGDGDKFPLPLALQNHQVLGGLRHFWVEISEDCHNIRQIWNVTHIASKSLETLDLAKCFFNSIRPTFITMDHFPSLKHLTISD